MITLLKNLELFAPQYYGVKNVLIVADKIYKILPIDESPNSELIEQIIDCEGLLGFPGLIDQHVHILGGGGEQGFGSRIAELDISEVRKAGVTTLVGLLGADGCTRSLECLYAKAKALELQGVTTFIYSGSYSIPPVTFTGSMVKDLVLIDKVIGAGEIAISDHRSSQPGLSDLLGLAWETHLGGLLGGKAGVVHLHVGDGKSGLGLLEKAVNESDLPIEQFVPTHVNRNPRLFEQALEYCRQGGNIDLTAGETVGLPVPDAVKKLLDAGLDSSKVTISSDANGSVPGGGVTKMQSLYEDIKACILRLGLSPETVIRLVTENVAVVLKLYPRKGVLKAGSDADILVTDRNMDIKMLFGMGRLQYKA